MNPIPELSPILKQLLLSGILDSFDNAIVRASTASPPTPITSRC